MTSKKEIEDLKIKISDLFKKKPGIAAKILTKWCQNSSSSSKEAGKHTQPVRRQIKKSA